MTVWVMVVCDGFMSMTIDDDALSVQNWPRGLSVNRVLVSVVVDRNSISGRTLDRVVWLFYDGTNERVYRSDTVRCSHCFE